MEVTILNVEWYITISSIMCRFQYEWKWNSTILSKHLQNSTASENWTRDVLTQPGQIYSSNHR